MPFWTLLNMQISSSSFWTQHVSLWIWRASLWFLSSSQGNPRRLGSRLCFCGWLHTSEDTVSSLQPNWSRTAAQLSKPVTVNVSMGKCFQVHRLEKTPELCPVLSGWNNTLFLWHLKNQCSFGCCLLLFFPAYFHVGHCCKVLRHQCSWKTFPCMLSNASENIQGYVNYTLKWWITLLHVIQFHLKIYNKKPSFIFEMGVLLCSPGCPVTLCRQVWLTTLELKSFSLLLPQV